MNVRELYFEWLIDLLDRKRCKRYSKLLSHLYDKDFEYSIRMDENRYKDGITLRHYYAEYKHLPDELVSDELCGFDCSILEMMVALSMRCEDIMSYSSTDDRTAVWFWNMIDNLGLSYYDDRHYNYQDVEEILDIFLNREYKPNGEGGLFTIHNPPCDIRDAEIWCQMTWYLNEQ